MSGTSYFQSILSDINNIGEDSVLAVLNQLNNNNVARKVPLFGNLIDLVYVDKDNSFLLVKFDFVDKITSNLDWLADEEKFNDECPWYFSESSHRVSPVYEMQRAKALFSLLHPDSEIHMLLVCNYKIINYDEVEEAWKHIGVRVVHRVSNTNQPAFHPTEEDKQKMLDVCVENPSKTEADFDKLLDQFFQSETPKKSNEKITIAEDDEEIVEEEIVDKEVHEDNNPGTFNIFAIKLFHGSIDTEDAHLQSSLRAFDIRQLKSISISFDATYSKSDVKYEKVVVNLYNETGLLLKSSLVNVNFICSCDDTKANFIHTFDSEIEWVKGSYVVEIKYLDTLVKVFSFSVGLRDIKGIFRPSKEKGIDIIEGPFDALNHMIGLNQVKEQLENYRNITHLSSLRKKNGLPSNMPPLHAVFMGKAGTGKTTVARLYGAILHELGLLSIGHIVIRERDQLVSSNFTYDDSETLRAIDEAKGGVLFINNVHSLYKSNDPRDTGRNVVETLLTALNDENQGDWALVLAGHPDGMANLLSMDQRLSSHIPPSNHYHFKDYTLNELMQIADIYCMNNNYLLSPDAREALRIKINHDYQLRDDQFGNAQHISTLFTSQILQSMALRVSCINSPKLFDLLTIEKADIPTLHLKDYKTSMKKLQGMIGLTELKKSIEGHLNMVKLTMLRNEQGIETTMPPLHMVFTGNPGTGKTTVASFIGEIYASLGLLSKGDVIYVERKDFVGQYIGDTEKNTIEILNRAKGNVLFIDEAYSLVPQNAERDYGHQALEVLLSTLSKEHIDMLVIMAGYPKEMEEMLNSNTGLKSRFPYTFHFVDYTADELMQIAESVVKKSNFSFTPAARRQLRKLVDHQLESKDAGWGNARFITRLISAHIIPAMGNRLAQLPPSKLKDKKRLCQICQEDIPAINNNIKNEHFDFDGVAIRRILKKLDSLVGLKDVKRNIHNFVQVVRYMHKQGSLYVNNEPLRWNFTGNTGTGKSTVAKILSELLKAMNLLEKGHLVEVKAEEIYNVVGYKTDEILLKAMQRSCHGILFIDGDAPQFKHPESQFSSESLRFKLTSMTMELPGVYALVIAENENATHVLTRNLQENGVSPFDHTLHFADYTEEELLSILKVCLKRKQLQLSSEASLHMAKYIHALASNRKLGYANARTMSKLAHSIFTTYILRKSTEPNSEDTFPKDLVQLSDVEHFVWKNTTNDIIGFVKHY